MARSVKKTNKKSARVAAKSKAPARSAKSAMKKAAKTAKTSKPAARKKPTRKIDPLNTKQYRSVTPNLSVSNIQRAMNFYTTVFGFKVRQVMDTPGGIVHAELNLRDTTLMLSPESREQNNLSANSIGNTPITLYVLVENVDDVFNKAVQSGAPVLMPVMDMFWGDRCGLVADPDGNKWMIATHKSEPTESEMGEAMRQMQQSLQADAGSAAAAGSR